MRIWMEALQGIVTVGAAERGVGDSVAGTFLPVSAAN